jgi:hypothetical protein
VEVDAYTWIKDVGRGNQPHVHRKMEGCPLYDVNSVLLTDKPVPGFLRLPSGGHTNFTDEYPADEQAWLIPIIADENMPIPPYHSRLRGYLDNSTFTTCDSANHIFVIEEIVHVYEVSVPTEGGFSVLPSSFPTDYTTWPRYHDATLGYNFAYPPGWQMSEIPAEEAVAAIAIHGPEWPNYPVEIRIYAGETLYDQYRPDAVPPLLKGKGLSIFHQELIYRNQEIAKQRLTGYKVVPPDTLSLKTATVSMLFSGNGHTYELMLRYPNGFDAQQALLNAYAVIVAGFEFDIPPGPSPTPPIKQELGAGPFLEQGQVVQQAQQTYGTELALVSAELVAEAEARSKQSSCATFFGHPDGVWLLVLHGPIKEADVGQTLPGTIYVLYDAKTGASLCAVITELDPTPTALPGTVEQAYPALTVIN